jgi:SpoIID/LytB domain protein
MSQWGAQAMALRGSTYREILDAFYPGTTLVNGDAR